MDLAFNIYDVLIDNVRIIKERMRTIGGPLHRREMNYIKMETGS